MPERIRLIEGDLTHQSVDALVNAANRTLRGGGGVDGALHRAAGPRLLEACRALPEVTPGVRCPTGEARITPGFDLPARWVIHTVGPIWRGEDRDVAELLAACYRNSLALAAQPEYNITSIAFPSLSTGAYGYPLEAAASIALKEIRRFLLQGKGPGLEEVRLVCFGEQRLSVYERVAEG